MGFAQGDEEKRLGLPVGMLNDRDKVNRPGSQHGFINFLVAPLTMNAVRIFHPLYPLARHLVQNLAAWRDIWVQEVSPSTEELAKRNADIDRIKDEAVSIRNRVVRPRCGSDLDGSGAAGHPRTLTF